MVAGLFCNQITKGRERTQPGSGEGQKTIYLMEGAEIIVTVVAILPGVPRTQVADAVRKV